jgi:VWFA-related protein
MEVPMPIPHFSPALIALLLSLLISAQQSPESPVIRTATHLVVLNVVVKDKHGKPVDDLKRGDFALRDNGHEQKIAMFALDDARQAPVATQASAPMTFTNRPALGAARVTAFLFDELNTQLGDQQIAKQQLLRYLKGLPANERVALFVLGDSLTLLHDFSQDTSALVAALASHSNRASPEAAASAAPTPSSNSLTGDSTTNAQWDSFLASSAQPYINYTQTVRALRTAAALETIAAHLQGIPGRKTLIWISSGFPIQLGLRSNDDTGAQASTNNRDSSATSRRGRSGGGNGNGIGSTGSTGGARKSGAGNANANSNSTSPNSQDSNLPGAGQSFETDVERAIRALNEADVAVYPVDARGLTVEAPFGADRASFGKRNKPPKGGSPVDFGYETMEGLADETGGRAYHNINDLNSAIQDAAGDARVSYSLAFYPSDSSLDDSYHRLQVAVQRSAVSVRFRPGYLATRQGAVSPSLADAVVNPVTLTGIGFTAHLDPVDGGYKLSVNVDPRNLTIDQKDGKWTGTLQFLVLVGKVEQLTTVPLNFTDEAFHRIQSQGLTVGARVKTPPGTTGFSLGFRDIPSGQVGTLHVPLLPAPSPQSPAPY